MKDPRDIILAPVVSEKSYEPDRAERCLHVQGRTPRASKPEIHDAVEAIWGVDVIKVNTLTRKGKATQGPQVRTSRGKKPDQKRAIVTLAAGNEIPLFES